MKSRTVGGCSRGARNRTSLSAMPPDGALATADFSRCRGSPGSSSSACTSRIVPGTTSNVAASWTRSPTSTPARGPSPASYVTSFIGDALHVPGLVEAPFAGFEPRYRVPESKPLKVLAGEMRVVGSLVSILLIEEEDPRVLGIAMRLVENHTGLLSRGRGQLLNRRRDRGLLTLFCRPFGRHHVGHDSSLSRYPRYERSGSMGSADWP